jgi:replicative DNA helicase
MPARFPGIDTPVRWSEALVVEASMDAGLGNMVRAQVTPAMLVDARNRIIYEAVMAETQRGGDPSWLSVMTRLTERGQHQAVEYATEHLTGNILLSAQVQNAISSVVDAYTHSGLQTLGRELAVYREQHPEATPEEIRSYIESSIQRLPSSTPDEAVSARSLLEGVGFSMTERAKAEADPNRTPPGLQFGIPGLDSITKGLHPGQVCILAARPGCGKTSLAVQFAVEQMMRGKHGLFFSYEMSSDELVERMIRNSYPMEDWVSSVEYSVKAAVFKLANLPGDIRIVDDSSVDETRVKAISRSARAAGQLDYIVVDYIQLMPCSRRIDNRQQELTLLSGRMKALAKEMEVPVLVLSQFSRASVSSGEPQLHHLRESGALEQDADKVILMWEPKETDDNARRAVEARVAKNRQGARGQAGLLFIADYFMFTDRAKEG